MSNIRVLSKKPRKRREEFVYITFQKINLKNISIGLSWELCIVSTSCWSPIDTTETNSTCIKFQLKKWKKFTNQPYFQTSLETLKIHTLVKILSSSLSSIEHYWNNLGKSFYLCYWYWNDGDMTSSLKCSLSSFTVRSHKNCLRFPFALLR